MNKMTKIEAGQLRKKLAQQSFESDIAWYDTCKLLHKVHYSGFSGVGGELAPVFELWGFEKWFDYVEMELGIHVGTANTMVRVAHFFEVRLKGKGKDRDQLSRQRLRALARRGDKVNEKNIDDWISRALEMSVCALEHELDDQKVIRKSVAFNFTVADAKIFSRAIDSLMEHGEFETRADAVMSLVTPKKGRRAA